MAKKAQERLEKWEVTLGELGFVWERCADEEETGGCKCEGEGLRIGRRMRSAGAWAKGFVLFGPLWRALSRE